MESIDLASLTVVTSKTPRRAEMSSSDAKTEAGFSEVLAGQEQERVEVDSGSNKVKPAKPKEKQADKVESEGRDRIAADDSKESDVEIEGESLFQEVPFQEVPSEETRLGEQVHLGEEIFSGEELSQVVENEDKDSANLDRQSVFPDSLVRSGDLPEQNDVSAGIQGGNGEGQILFVADSVAVKSSEAEGAANTDNLTLKNGELIKNNETLASISLAADKTEFGSRAGKEDGLAKGRGASSVLNDEGSISPAKDVDPELKLVAGIKSAEASESEENFIHVENDQISNKNNQEPVTAAADVAALKGGDESGRQIKNGPESLFDTQAHKGNISLNGSVAVEIPEDVKIHINNEITAARDKPENGAVRSGQGLRKSSLSGGETGTVHLQGRARESQSTFIQKEQNLIKYSDSKPDSVDEKFSFSGISKEIIEEQVTLSTSHQAGVKEKQIFGKTVSGSNDLIAVNLVTGKESLVKSGPEIISAKPLPISDDHLMNQIKTGMLRQVRGRQTVTIKLWPESLGKVDVKLVLREQQLSATFMVEQSDVKDAMLRKIDSLRDGLSMRGVDVKDIDVKVTPPKSGDGPSVTVGDQRQENADVWRQYHQDDFSRSESGSTSPDGGENGNKDSISLSDNLSAEIISTIDRGVISGSLHITA